MRGATLDARRSSGGKLPWWGGCKGPKVGFCLVKVVFIGFSWVSRVHSRVPEVCLFLGFWALLRGFLHRRLNLGLCLVNVVFYGNTNRPMGLCQSME